MVIGSTNTDIAIIGYRPIWPIRLLSADTDTDTDIGPYTNLEGSLDYARTYSAVSQGR